jgi:hypothetical protein
MGFDVENECIRKKFQGCHPKDFFLSRTQKESIFWEFSWMLIFNNNSNSNLLDVFYR